MTVRPAPTGDDNVNTTVFPTTLTPDTETGYDGVPAFVTAKDDANGRADSNSDKNSSNVNVTVKPDASTTADCHTGEV